MEQDSTKLRERTEKMFLKQVQEKLHEMRKAAQKKHWNQETRSHFTSPCFTIKGQAQTMGFTLLSQVVASLAEFIDKNRPMGTEGDRVIVNKHLEVVELACEHHTVRDGGETGQALLKALQALTKHYV